MLVLIVMGCGGLAALNVDWPAPFRPPEAPVEPPDLEAPLPPLDGPTVAPPGTPPTGGTPPTPPDPHCLEDAPDPGPPARPANVEVVTVSVRTGDGSSDGTTDPTVELCLGDDCFPLGQGAGVQLAPGAVGVWMFEGLSLSRAELDEVELRMDDGGDHWHPVGLDVRLDGEPVYCAELVGVEMGSESGEVLSWSDPAGLHLGCTSVWDDRTLTHGPMVRSVGPDRAEVWVRTDATRPVAVRIRPTADPAAARIAGWVYPLAADDFTGVVPVDCLAPATAYTYEVLVDGVVAAEHAFVTAPADGAAGAFRLSFGSGAIDPAQPVFAALEAHAPDLFTFTGDAHPGDTDDLDSLRWWYRWALERPERAAFLAGTPALATWDDRDFLGPGSDGYSPGKDRALRAFLEYQPNPGAGTAATPGVFFATRWGDVDLFVLDGRYWRGLDDGLLGDAQRAWLEDELARATGTFKLLVLGSDWSLEGDPEGFASAPDERQALLDAIDALGIPGVILVSGGAGRGELRAIDAPAYALPAIASGPLAGAPSGCPWSSELLACASEPLWVTLSFDTTLADPAVTATLHDLGGAPIASHGWTLSALTP